MGRRGRNEKEEEALGSGGTSSDVPDGEPPQRESARMSERRRYWIMKQLVKWERVTVQDLRKDRRFQDAFGRVVDDSTLQEDFRQIEGLMGDFCTVVRPNASTLRRVSLNLLRKSNPSDSDPDLAEKRRIGRTVLKLLGPGEEVVYLSTGTTVEVTAQALLHRDKHSVSVVLTDNFKVTDLFRLRAPVDPKMNRMRLVVLGGTAVYEFDDIVQDFDLQQLVQWHCTTAVVSAKAINPATGRIYSTRQPEIKKRIFRDDKYAVPKVIIPVVKEKISPTKGGLSIYDPHEKHGTFEDREYLIVSTNLEPKVREALVNHGYKVHDAHEEDDADFC